MSLWLELQEVSLPVLKWKVRAPLYFQIFEARLLNSPKKKLPLDEMVQNIIVLECLIPSHRNFKGT
jgi:hypothetical protein